jgi:hypothetical protein
MGTHPSLGSGHGGNEGQTFSSHVVSHLTAHTLPPTVSYTSVARQLGDPELEQCGFGGQST